jgi:hypothetical protein
MPKQSPSNRRRTAIDFQRMQIRLFDRLETEVIERYRHATGSIASLESKRLSSNLASMRRKDFESEFDYQMEQMHAADEHEYILATKELGDELAIVALYKLIEITTKRVVRLAFPGISAANLYKIKELKKALKQKGIQIEKLDHYQAMDEIRCLNNAIKHDGIVGAELAAYPSWTLKQKLTGLDAAYERLAPLCERYHKALVEALVTAI